MHPSRINFYLADEEGFVALCAGLQVGERPHCVYGVITLFRMSLKFRCELWSDFGRTFVNCE